MVALTLSDAFCVDRWRREFLHLLLSGTVDLLFANEVELRSLYQTEDFDAALAAFGLIFLGTAWVAQSRGREKMYG